MDDVSCGNATIANIADAKQTPISPVQPPPTAGPRWTRRSVGPIWARTPTS